MSQPPLPPPLPPNRPLQYQSSRMVQPLDYSPAKRFWMAVLGGSIVSAAVWILGGKAMFKGSGDALMFAAFTLLGIKFFTFIGCLFVERWRLFGVGLFVSMAVGVMIFFGVCVTQM